MGVCASGITVCSDPQEEWGTFRIRKGEQELYIQCEPNYHNLASAAQAQIPEFNSKTFRFRSADTQATTVTNTDELVRALKRNQFILSLIIEEDTGYEFENRKLTELSLATVKIFHTESKKVKATGIIINKKYVITTYVGPDKILNPFDIYNYEYKTRGNTQLAVEPQTYYPELDGVVLFLPSVPAIIFEMAGQSDFSTQLSQKHMRMEYFAATMMYYTKDIPTLHAWEGMRMEQFDQDHFVHEGELEDDDGSEGAPIFVNRSNIADDWELCALRVNSQDISCDDNSLAVKSDRIIKALTQLDRSTRDKASKIAIREICRLY